MHYQLTTWPSVGRTNVCRVQAIMYKGKKTEALALPQGLGAGMAAKLEIAMSYVAITDKATALIEAIFHANKAQDYK